jgi:SAM-dependent methyltransferase
MQKETEKCCITSCDKPLDEQFWNTRYELNETGWDLGAPSPPLKAYIDQLTDKNISILIPGCGNTYEAEYLLENGFTNVTVIDIAPLLVAQLKEKFKGNKHINIIHGDFFSARRTI